MIGGGQHAILSPIMRLSAILFILHLPALATTLSVVPVFEPISLHATDVDDEVSKSGKTLQAAVLSRPMVISGALPETIVEAVRTPHRMPTNDPNYTVEEVNLLELCRIGIAAEVIEGKLEVALNVSKVSIPEELELTIRQILELAFKAVRSTLEVYQKPQLEPLKVRFLVAGTDEGTASLKDLEIDFELPGA